MGGGGEIFYGEKIEDEGLSVLDIPSRRSLCSTNACSLLHDFLSLSNNMFSF
jgi:hypothetical protein